MIVAREKLVICRLDGLVMQNTKHLFNSIMGTFKLKVILLSATPQSLRAAPKTGLSYTNPLTSIVKLNRVMTLVMLHIYSSLK